MRRRHFLAGVASAAAVPELASAQAVRARTLVIAQNFDPTSLWPNSTTASDNINAGAVIVQPLFWVNPRTARPEPLLAETLVVEGPTAVRVKLRAGIRFTNGEKMDADAVVYSIELFRDIKQTPAYVIYATSIERAEKIDDLTVRVITKYPSPVTAFVLTQIYVVPPRYWVQAGIGGFGQKPVGTGPFRLVDWVKDSRLVMERNPEYWGDAPRGIERLEWRPVPDDTARAAGLQAGEFDITSALALPDVTGLENDASVTLASVPSFRIYTVSLSSLSVHRSPLHDRRVRQALNYAVDKDSLIRNVLFGRARALNGQLLRREQLGFNPALKDYPYDPARAKALLTEAGFPSGFEIEFKFPSGRYAQDREVSEAVAGVGTDGFRRIGATR